MIYCRRDAEKSIAKLEELGYGGLPICVAKTQYSLTDDPLSWAVPRASPISVSKVKVSAGAGFIVVQDGRHYDHARSAQGARRGAD